MGTRTLDKHPKDWPPRPFASGPPEEPTGILKVVESRRPFKQKKDPTFWFEGASRNGLWDPGLLGPDAQKPACLKTASELEAGAST